MYKISEKYNENPIDISEEEASVLKEASTKVRLALFFEKNFEYLIQNYLDYENTIALKSVSQLVQKNQSLSELNGHITDVNVKLLNLFSTSRAYIDKSSSIVRKLTGLKDLFKKECSQHYDTNFSYRIIDALRNYAQHNNAPLSSLTLGGEWVGRENLEFYTNPIIDTEVLRSNKVFRKSVLPEKDVKLHLSYCIRRYIECLSAIHKKISMSFESDLKTFRTKNKEIFLAKNFTADADIIFLYEKSEYQTIYINFNRYFELNKKHTGLINISNHCVSTCPKANEKEVVKELDKIRFNSKEKEKIYYISMRSSHGENIASDIELITLPEECQSYFQALIDSAS